MSRSLKWWAVALSWVLIWGRPTLSQTSREAELASAAGRTFFVEPWSVQDPRSPDGDGLGPMHNATSCAACHHQSGAGGGGDAHHNVELLSIVPIELGEAAKARFIANVIDVHAGFQGRTPTQLLPNIVLHRHSSDARYADFRSQLLGPDAAESDNDPSRAGIAAIERLQARPVQVIEPVPGIVFNLSQRNTPALWGAGLIDSIPDGVIEDMAKTQKKVRKATAGRVPPASRGGVGRFGWRGQTGRLREFVINACANELGLQTRTSFQAINPLAPNDRRGGRDMSETEVNELVAFLANLPRPVETQPEYGFEAETLRQGERVFERIGCANCHPRSLGKVEGLFSDLLLHDMGPGLDDPVEPNPASQLHRAQHGYSGGGSVFVAKVKKVKRDPSLPRQWRTPPLWGVSDSAPYLHDGRATTLTEAILLHGGQGAESAKLFQNLPNADRTRLMGFLNTLKAPPQPQVKVGVQILQF